MTDFDSDSVETSRHREEARSGDASAFGGLFAHYQSALLQFIARHLDARSGARLDPSDVVQETQPKAYCRMDTFMRRRPMPIRAWLRTTAWEPLLKALRWYIEAARRYAGMPGDHP